MPIFIIILLISSVYAATNITLDLKWKNAFQFAGFYMAKEKGFYKKFGLNVNFNEFHGNNIVNDVLTNKADFGIGNSSLIYYKLKEKPVIALMPIFENTPLALVSTDPSIKSIKDLKGKTIHSSNMGVYNIAIVAMLKKEGIDIKDIKCTNKPYSINDLIHKKGIYIIFSTDQLYYLQKNNVQYKLFSPLSEGIDTYGDILFTSEKFLKNNPKTVKNFVKATQKGWEYAKNHIDETITVILKKYNTQHFTYDKLKDEAYKTIPFLSKDFLFKRDKINAIKLLYQLIFNIKNNFHFLDFVYSPYIMSKKEKEFIENNIIHCISASNWPPFNYMKHDKLTGISIDFWNLISNRTYLKKTCEIAPNFTTALKKIENKEADILPNTTNTEKREKYAIFTKPYATYPIVIATKNNVSPILDMENLYGKKVAIGKNYTAYELIKKHYPKIKIVQVNNTEEGLKLLEKGDVFAVIDIFPVLGYFITKDKFLDINIKGVTPFSFPLKFMIRDDYKTLQQILNRAIDDLTPQEKIEILNKYFTVVINNGIPYKQVKTKIIIGITVIATLLLMLILLIILYLKIKKIKKELEMVATHDKLLTNILNRLAIDKRLNEEIEKAKRYNTPLSIIYFDIDHFKQINDTYGHAKGDFVLKEISDLIQQNIRKTDIFGRWGGEEFLIILPFTKGSDAKKLAEKLRQAIENHDFNGLKVTASFGVTEYNEEDDYISLMQRADVALYLAKEKGRNRIIYIK
ncbi:polar amino acid transport system substrate-binding protein [Lebetimonas natsushimae]|uniref:diguanylate cyclase n=1 Tax=Lebetimonas natsushimae TaxID=1936991 RepID=A0A292YB60_9BACT|nr:diguanylate cyclase [Lebetimonas natsushimae]GAX86769.1 polar amino acid transport system substrate-binding protein [Lebetimonas natsushimae]